MKKCRLMTILVLVLALLLSCVATDASAAKKSSKAKDPTVQVRVNGVEFLYDEARSMLDMLNAFRTGEDAWQLKKNNKTRQYVKNLKPLQYDYDLERVAMQRALELAVYFSHTRPNGKAWSTAYVKKTSTKGENLAYGQIGIAEAFIALREDDKDYNGQGHRRNMLRRNYTRVGFGAVRVGNTIYIAQEFANGKVRSDDTDRFGSNVVDVSWATLLKSGAGNLGGHPGELNLAPGESAPLPEICIYSHSGVRLTILNQSWGPPADGIVYSDGASLTAAGTGWTSLAAEVCGNPVYLPVTVAEREQLPEPTEQTEIDSYETPLGTPYFITLPDDECYEYPFILPNPFARNK